jgi:hypothetical protein
MAPRKPRTALTLATLEIHRGVDCPKFAAFKQAKNARPLLPQTNWAYLGADEVNDRVADGIAHPTNDAISPLMKYEFEHGSPLSRAHNAGPITLCRAIIENEPITHSTK